MNSIKAKKPPHKQPSNIHPPRKSKFCRPLRTTSVRSNSNHLTSKKSTKIVPRDQQHVVLEQFKFNSEILASIRAMRGHYRSPANSNPTKNIILQPPLTNPRITSLQRLIILLDNSQVLIAQRLSPYLNIDYPLSIFSNVNILCSRLEDKPHLFGLKHSPAYRRQLAQKGSFYQRNADFNMNHILNILKQQITNQVIESGIVNKRELTEEERKAMGYDSPSSAPQKTTIFSKLHSLLTSKPTPQQLIATAQSPLHPAVFTTEVIQSLTNSAQFDYSLQFQPHHFTPHELFTLQKQELLNDFFPNPNFDHFADVQAVHNAMNGVQPTSSSPPTASSLQSPQQHQSILKPKVKFYEIELLKQLEAKQLVPMQFRVKNKLEITTLTPIPSSLKPYILQQPEYTQLIDKIADLKRDSVPHTPQLQELQSKLDKSTTELINQITDELQQHNISSNSLKTMPLYMAKEIFKSALLSIPEVSDEERTHLIAQFRQDFQQKHQKSSIPFENTHKYHEAQFHTNYLDHLYTHLSTLGTLPTSQQSTGLNIFSEDLVSVPQESTLSFLDSQSTKIMCETNSLQRVSTHHETGLAVFVPTQNLATIPSKQQHIDAKNTTSSVNMISAAYQQTSVPQNKRPFYISPTNARKFFIPTTFSHDLSLHIKHLLALPHDLTFLRQLVANPVIFNNDIYTHFEYTEPELFQKFTSPSVLTLHDRKDIIEINYMIYMMINQAMYNKHFNLLPQNDPGIAFLTPGASPLLIDPNMPQSTSSAVTTSPNATPGVVNSAKTAKNNVMQRLHEEFVASIAPEQTQFVHHLSPSSSAHLQRHILSPQHCNAIDNQLLYKNNYYIHHLASTDEEMMHDKIHFNMLLNNPQMNENFVNLVALKWHHDKEDGERTEQLQQQQQSLEQGYNIDANHKLNVDTTFFLNCLFNNGFSNDSFLSISEQYSRYTQQALNDYITELSNPNPSQSLPISQPTTSQPPTNR